MAGTDLSTQQYDADCTKVQPDEINALVTWLKKGIETVTDIDDTDSPYTILATDAVIMCDTDSGAITVNLPAGIAGKRYKIVNAGSSGNAVTIAPNGAELFFGNNATFDLTDGKILEFNYSTAQGWY